MSPEEHKSWLRVDHLFSQALEFPSDDRRAFLDRACQGETERQRLERLLSLSVGDGPTPTEALDWFEWLGAAPPAVPAAPTARM